MSKHARSMDWDGAVNAWHVAGGVYRMGRREWLTEAGSRQAYDDGIRTVIDLRHAAEARRRDTDPVAGGSAWSGMIVVSAPTEEPNDPTADGYRRAARGINERYRTHGPPHARECYLAEDELATLLQQRGDAVAGFVRNPGTRAFLLGNGLSPAELDAVPALSEAAYVKEPQ